MTRAQPAVKRMSCVHGDQSGSHSRTHLPSQVSAVECVYTSDCRPLWLSKSISLRTQQRNSRQLRHRWSERSNEDRLFSGLRAIIHSHHRQLTVDFCPLAECSWGCDTTNSVQHLCGDRMDVFPIAAKKLIVIGVGAVLWIILKTGNDACFRKKFSQDPPWVGVFFFFQNAIGLNY